MARSDGTSGYLQSGPRYFPSHAPTWFSYTLDFAKGGRYYNHGMVKVANIAEKKLSGSRIDYHKGILEDPQVVVNLKVLSNAARQSELAFLNKYGLPNPGNDWGELIKAFTMLFSSQAAIEQNLKIIEQTMHGDLGIKDNRHIYFVTHFASNVQTAAREVVRSRLSLNTTADDFDAMLDEIIEIALKKTFSQKVYVDGSGVIHTNDVTDEDKKIMRAQEAYAELLDHIEDFKNNPYFKNTILGLLGVDRDFLKKTMKAQKNKKAQPTVRDAYSNGNIKGTIGEVFEVTLAELMTKQLHGTVANGDLVLNWETAWSGGSGVKADVMSHNIQRGKEIVNIDGLMSQEGDDNSKRVNTIRRYREWFEKMKDAYGDIVFISDKNYQIKSGFKGFTAQNKVTLNNLAGLLSEVGGMGGVNIRNLIDYLSNCGADMLLTNHADKAVLDSIAMQIGHFLFDDLTITATVSINRLHLLNLSGFYVPLSVYLDGLISAIESTAKDISGFVTVSFHSAGASAAASPWSGEEDFYAFREHQLNNSYVDIHFMKNFAQFITSQVSFR